MTKIKSEELAKVIDTCIEASEKIDHIEITVKGLCTDLKNEIEEITAKLYFNYRTTDEEEK